LEILPLLIGRSAGSMLMGIPRLSVKRIRNLESSLLDCLSLKNRQAAALALSSARSYFFKADAFAGSDALKSSS